MIWFSCYRKIRWRSYGQIIWSSYCCCWRCYLAWYDTLWMRIFENIIPAACDLDCSTILVKVYHMRRSPPIRIFILNRVGAITSLRNFHWKWFTPNIWHPFTFVTKSETLISIYYILILNELLGNYFHVICLWPVQSIIATVIVKIASF